MSFEDVKADLLMRLDSLASEKRDGIRMIDYLRRKYIYSYRYSRGGGKTKERADKPDRGAKRKAGNNNSGEKNMYTKVTRREVAKQFLFAIELLLKWIEQREDSNEKTISNNIEEHSLV